MTERIVRIGSKENLVRIERDIMRVESRPLDSILLIQDRGPIAVRSRDWQKAVQLFGASFAPMAPVYLNNLIATPAITSAVIEWDVDVPAYHRVRYARVGYGWSYSGWSPTPSTHATIALSGLTPEHEQYLYQVQSCLVGDGSASFDWEPEVSAIFFTLCSNTITYSGFEMQEPGDPYVFWHWHTNVLTQGKAQWRYYPSGSFQGWSSYFGAYGLETTLDSHPGLIPDPVKQYEVQIRSRNRCGYEGTVMTYRIYYSGGHWNYQMM